MLEDGGVHAGGVAGADQVADERTAGRCEGHHDHEEDAADAAYDVGNGQRTFAQMLNVEEEQEPGGQGQEVLQHGPERDVEHVAQYGQLQPGNAVEAVLGAVDAVARVDDEKDE